MLLEGRYLFCCDPQAQAESRYPSFVLSWASQFYASLLLSLASQPLCSACLFGVVAFLVSVLLIGVPGVVSLRLFKITYPSTYRLGLLGALAKTLALPGSAGGDFGAPPFLGVDFVDGGFAGVALEASKASDFLRGISTMQLVNVQSSAQAYLLFRDTLRAYSTQSGFRGKD
jgi:hypothetical protein